MGIGVQLHPERHRLLVLLLIFTGNVGFWGSGSLDSLLFVQILNPQALVTASVFSCSHFWRGTTLLFIITIDSNYVSG